MTSGCDALIIGEPSDPHVEAVARYLDQDRTIVIDAASLPSMPYLLTEDAFELAGRSDLMVPGRTRGWVRRLAPADWGHGTPAGSHAAVVQASAISLLAGVTRVPGIEWVTRIDPLLIAESKLVQIRAARELRIRVPRTIVTNRAHRAIAELGPQVVIKPLGPGHFTTDDGTAAVVYATEVDLNNPDLADLGEAPFLLQELLLAQSHLRVVTVGHRCWVTQLDASGLPLDWRADDAAHHSFADATQTRPHVGNAATRLARSLNLGYSSQDWIVTAGGEEVLLDVNPAGQWLFLPESVGQQVSAALAAFLRGE